MKEKKEKPQEVMKTKMRVSLLDKNLVKMEDRLVDQDTEFRLGAKLKHKGPVCLEVTLRDKQDVDDCIKYLGQLLGDLPLAERKVYKAAKKSVGILDAEPIKELLKDIERKCETLDQLIKYLREKGFKFVTSEFISDKGLPVTIKDNHKDYQFMIRCIKEAKDPKNDKFDPQLILGMKFMGEKKKGAKVYLYNKFEKTLEIDWEKKSDINFKKIQLTKFPPYMIMEEREKYRAEERKYQLNPDLERSKFWLRWNPAVEEYNKGK